MRVSFVGAGPGDPGLLTLKGLRRIRKADIIIFAGSLVNPKILKHAKPEAKIYDSKTMNLEQIVEIIINGASRGQKVVRLQTGDLSLYSALMEQIIPIENAGISVEIIPGVSSFQAAAASLKREYTIPGGTQTLILSRTSGRTTVPLTENIREIVKLNSSVVFFLSIAKLDCVVKEILNIRPASTPVAVCYKVSWPDEKVIIGNLGNIVNKVEKGNIKKKTALILLGDFLKKNLSTSRLYDKYFTHEYRNKV